MGENGGSGKTILSDDFDRRETLKRIECMAETEMKMHEPSM